jgi:ABC-2 type transport system ATP-binding protein
MLTIENLTKIYPSGKIGVENLSLQLEQGDLCAFIGSNGAGKTTTIDAIVGIHDFNQGEIYIDGHSMKTNPTLGKQALAYLPDNPDIYEQLTGQQYLNFIADTFNMSLSARNTQIEKFAAIFNMTDNLNMLISSYSHGMKQRLSLISAFMHTPKLLILDEPFVGLDPKGAITLREQMQNLCASGSTIFFSTHVLEVAERLCNKVAIINHGRLVSFGQTSEIIKNKSLEEIFMEVV